MTDVVFIVVVREVWRILALNILCVLDCCIYGRVVESNERLVVDLAPILGLLLKHSLLMLKVHHLHLLHVLLLAHKHVVVDVRLVVINKTHRFRIDRVRYVALVYRSQSLRLLTGGHLRNAREPCISRVLVLG